MIIGIDFDLTIAGPKSPPYQVGPPLPGAKESLEAFKKANHYIMIHSCRSSDGPRAIKVMTDYLNFFNIPYDSAWDGIGKPDCDFFIDDKAIRFENNWPEIQERILNDQTIL